MDEECECEEEEKKNRDENEVRIIVVEDSEEEEETETLGESGKKDLVEEARVAGGARSQDAEKLEATVGGCNSESSRENSPPFLSKFQKTRRHLEIFFVL